MLDQKYFVIDPNLKDRPITGSLISYQKRMNIPSKLVIHHSMGNKNIDVEDKVIIDQFSSVGFNRGYTTKDNKGGIVKLPSFHLKPYSNDISYAQAHFALHKHNNKWCVIPLVKYPMSDICWHAGDVFWYPETNKINEDSFGLEICGDYRFEELEEEALDCIAKVFIPYAKYFQENVKNIAFPDSGYVPKNQAFAIFGHKDFANTECPGMIYNQLPLLRDKILKEI